MARGLEGETYPVKIDNIKDALLQGHKGKASSTSRVRPPTAGALKRHAVVSSNPDNDNFVAFVNVIFAGLKKWALTTNGRSAGWRNNDTAENAKKCVDLAQLRPKEFQEYFQEYYDKHKDEALDEKLFSAPFASGFLQEMKPELERERDKFLDNLRGELWLERGKEFDKVQDCEHTISYLIAFFKEEEYLTKFDYKDLNNNFKAFARNIELSAHVGYDEQKINDAISKMEKEAATKIQAGFRGYQARKQAGELRAQKQQEEGAAVKIQAAWRGYKARKRSKDLADRITESGGEGDVIKIQALWRGRAARKKFEALKEEKKHQAATTIQAAFRGYQVRKEGELQNAKKAAQEAKKAEEEAKKAEAEAKKNEEIAKIKEALKKDYETQSGGKKRYDREGYVKKMLEIRGLKEGDNYYEEYKKELEASPTYGIHGYDSVLLEDSVHPNDSIKFSTSGIEYADFNIEQGGTEKFNQLLEDYRKAKKDGDGILVVKMDGEITRSKLIDGEVQTRQKVVAKKDKDGNEISETITETVVTKETPPSYIIHKDGTTTIQTFVTKDVVDGFLNLAKEDYDKAVDELTEEFYKELQEEDEEKLKSDPNFKPLEGEERAQKVQKMVQGAIYEKSQTEIQNAIQEHKARNEIYLRNSLSPIEAALGAKYKGKNVAQRRAIRDLASITEPYGVQGISIVKEENIVKVAFHQDEDQQTINDTVYVAVYRDLVQRAQVATYDGEEIEYYKNGVIKTIQCYKGQIVPDEGTLVYRGNNGEIKPVVVNKGLFGKKKALTLEEHFEGQSGAYENAKRKYNKMTFQYTSMMGLDMSSAILLPGDKKKVFSSKVPKVACLDSAGEPLQVARELPKSIQDLATQGGFKTDRNKVIPIPNFSTLLFDHVAVGDRAALLEKAQNSLFLKPKYIVQESDVAAFENMIRMQKMDIMKKRTPIDDLFIVPKGWVYNESLGIPKELFDYLQKNEVKYLKAPIAGTMILEDGIFDENGKALGEEALKNEYGKKFIKELKQTRLAPQIADEKANLQERFLKAVKAGNINIAQESIKYYNQRLEEVYQEISKKTYPFLTHDEKRRQQAQDISKMMDNYCFDIHALTGIYKQDALQIAIENGQFEMVKLLLQEGFNPSIKSSKKPSSKEMKEKTKGSGMNAHELYLEKYKKSQGDKVEEELAKANAQSWNPNPIMEFLKRKEQEIYEARKAGNIPEENKITINPPVLNADGTLKYHKHGIGDKACDANDFYIYVNCNTKITNEYFSNQAHSVGSDVGVRVYFDKDGAIKIDKNSLRIYDRTKGQVISDPQFNKGKSSADFIQILQQEIFAQFTVDRTPIERSEQEFLKNVAALDVDKIPEEVISCEEFNINAKNKDNKTALDLIITQLPDEKAQKILKKIMNAGINIDKKSLAEFIKIKDQLDESTKESIIDNLNSKSEGVRKTSIEVSRNGDEVIYVSGYYCENDCKVYCDTNFNSKRFCAETFVIPSDAEFHIVNIKDGKHKTAKMQSGSSDEMQVKVNQAVASFKEKEDARERDFSIKNSPASTVKVSAVERLNASSRVRL